MNPDLYRYKSLYVWFFCIQVHCYYLCYYRNMIIFQSPIFFLAISKPMNGQTHPLLSVKYLYFDLH